MVFGWSSIDRQQDVGQVFVKRWSDKVDVLFAVNLDELAEGNAILKTTKLTISRYWNNPQIETIITNDSIGLSIGLNDFAAALTKEIGSVMWTFKQATFEKQVSNAIQVVLSKIKEESIKIM